MQAHKSDISLATLQGMNENHVRAIEGLRVLAKIVARFHVNRYLRPAPNAEMESHKQGAENEKDA